MKTLFAGLDRNLGRCPRCMQKAFFSALGAWLLVGVAITLGSQSGCVVAKTLALALTALWLLHICVFALRATKNRASKAASRASIGPARHDPGVHVPSRRWLVIDFAATLAVTAAVTMIPRQARAQAECGCRVGDICCNADTDVTWECQDIQGCTQWILKGNACTPTQRNKC